MDVPCQVGQRCRRFGGRFRERLVHTSPGFLVVFMADLALILVDLMAAQLSTLLKLQIAVCHSVGCLQVNS